MVLLLSVVLSQSPGCDRDAWLTSLNEALSLEAPVAETPRTAAWTMGHEHPCAKVATSDDGHVRLWVHRYERFGEADDADLEPGEAHLQWRDRTGRIHVVQLDPELHLDTVIDQITAMGDGRYLFLGLRSCFAIFPGGCPRRFARLVELGTNGKVISPKEGLILLTAGEPETGKFRHHMLARGWLVLRGATIWFEPCPHASVRRPEELPTVKVATVSPTKLTPLALGRSGLKRSWTFNPER